jgi:nitrilase
MRVAAIQMTATPDKSRNLTEAYRLFQEAIDRGSDLVAFPENFSILTDDGDQFLEESETLKGLTVETLQEWAAEYDVWILGGTIPLRMRNDPKKVTNTSLLVSNKGDIHARYDKIHLFDVQVSETQSYEESKYISAGKKVVTTDTPWTKVGLSVCYDLRFPELYRKQSELGAQLLFAPSAFTKPTGAAHWDVLTRARAIENLAYVVAPAQTGISYPGRESYGYTRIVDPWGRVIAERTAGPGIVWAPLNFDRLEKIRKDFPVLESRKL